MHMGVKIFVPKLLCKPETETENAKESSGQINWLHLKSREVDDNGADRRKREALALWEREQIL